MIIELPRKLTKCSIGAAEVGQRLLGTEPVGRSGRQRQRALADLRRPGEEKSKRTDIGELEKRGAKRAADRGDHATRLSRRLGNVLAPAAQRTLRFVIFFAAGCTTRGGLSRLALILLSDDPSRANELVAGPSERLGVRPVRRLVFRHLQSADRRHRVFAVRCAKYAPLLISSLPKFLHVVQRRERKFIFPEGPLHGPKADHRKKFFRALSSAIAINCTLSFNFFSHKIYPDTQSLWTAALLTFIIYKIGIALPERPREQQAGSSGLVFSGWGGSEPGKPESSVCEKQEEVSLSGAGDGHSRVDLARVSPEQRKITPCQMAVSPSSTQLVAARH